MTHIYRQLEQRHADQLRMVQEMAQAERDQLVSQLQRELDKRQQQLGQAKEEETRLKDSVLLLNEVCTTFVSSYLMGSLSTVRNWLGNVSS
jgi:septal ring factor EnvC (AmiA/AmiB activator)